LKDDPRPGAGGHLYVFRTIRPITGGGAAGTEYGMNKLLGIIGGRGLYSRGGPGVLKCGRSPADIPWAGPSDPMCFGRLAGKEVAFLFVSARGAGIVFRRNPSELNFRANIYGFKAERKSASSELFPLAPARVRLAEGGTSSAESFVVSRISFFDRSAPAASPHFLAKELSRTSVSKRPVCPQAF